MGNILASIGVTSFALALIYFLGHHDQPSKLTYPPGPSVTNMPTHNIWIEYQNWARQYG